MKTHTGSIKSHIIEENKQDLNEKYLNNNYQYNLLKTLKTVEGELDKKEEHSDIEALRHMKVACEELLRDLKTESAPM